jgi:hypothetical protein
MLSKVGEWLIDTVKKVVKIFDGILQTFLGSSGYRMIKKFLGTLTLQADSFAYSTGEENGLSIGSHGLTTRLTGFNYDNVSWLTDLNLNTVHDTAMAIVRAMGLNPSYDSTIDSLLYTICANMASPNLQDNPYYNLWLKINNVSYTSPSWINIIAQTVHPSTILWKTTWAFDYFNRFIKYMSNTVLSINQMLQYMLGAILDVNHINDAAGYMDKLQSTDYLTVDLPCSTLYFWLVGSDVYVTRRVSPCVIFKDLSWESFDGFCNHVLWKLSNSQEREWHWARKVRVTSKSFGQFIDELRTTNEKYVNTDEEMAKAVTASNIVDAVYLDLIKRSYDAGDTMDSIVSEHKFTDYTIEGTTADACFQALTGRSYSDYSSAFRGMTSSDISNLVLCNILGATLGTITLTGASTEVFTDLLFYATNNNYYIPYQHLSSIPAGRYRVITDKELADVSVTLLEIVAVVAGTLLVIKVAGKLKRKALAARTKADAFARNQVIEGVYDQAAVNAQYKLQRKADIMQKLSSALFNGVGKIVSSTTTAVKSMVTATAAKLRTLVSGSRDGVETDTSLADIEKLITG